MKLALAQTIRKRIVVEDIEPRILYSADALAVSQLLVDDTTANNQLVLVLDAENQQSNNATQQPPVSNSSQSETTQTQNTASADNQNTTAAASTEVDSAQQQTRKEIVFVDSRVADYQQLVDDILANATLGQSIEVVMIHDDEDGLQTILDTLKTRGQVDAIHLLGEGANAELILGNRLLNAEQLAAQSDLFKEIGQHLTADADILIYGCNFAQDATGQAMVQTLADLTGADVAASDDRTGHASENGDWVLEYYSGKVESEIPLSLATQASWEHALATFTVTTNADSATAGSVVGTLRWAITQANAVGGTDNIVFNLSSGNETIRLVSALPAINSQIHFSVTNGTQAIISGDTNNNGVADINSGFVFDATGGSSSINGITIRDFVADGIRLNNAQSIVVTNSVISNNNVGIRIAGDSRFGVYTSNTISNNAVGISIDNGYYNEIGGTTASLGNVITNNTGSGVRMTGGSSWYNAVIGNQIYANGGLGIDLNADNTVLLNDANDSDGASLANLGQNYTVISAVSYNSTTQELTITGHLDSQVRYFRLEFFGLEAANVDANGYGEGQVFLGSYLFYNNTGGNFSATLTGVSLANIEAITSTATSTDASQTNFYDTSEFSAQYNTSLLVNDAPTISSIGQQVTATNTALYFNASNANQIIISDVDAGSNSVRVSINSSNGRFTLASLTGLTFTTGDGTADSSMVFTGTLTNINNALNNAFFNPTSAFSGTADLTVTVNDLGNQGSGGALTASDTINIQVGAVTFQQGVNGYSGVQDVRIVTVTPNTNYGTEIAIYQNAGEQVLIKFEQLFGNGAGQIPFGSIITSASLTVNVDDTGSQTSEIYRVLNLSWNQATSTWNSVANGVQLDNVEASSTALTSLTTNTLGYVTYSGLASSLQAWSNGETNNGWVITKSGGDWRFASSENATASIRPYLTVSYTLPVPPVVTTSVGTTTHIENTSSTAVDNAITVTDADSTNLSGATIRVANNYVNGQDTLSFVNQSGITGNWNSATGTLTLSGNASVVAYQTALRSIGFSNNSEAPDTLTRTISFATTDTLGYTSTAVTKSLVITPVNDAPSGADSTVTINEDATHTFTAANFGFTDVDSNTFTAVRISTLPTLGTLTLNGVAVTAGQSITVTDINAGLLVFTPVTDGNGTNYSNFTFQVQDNGGTANGGVDLDATPNTITFNITAVNDAPTIASLGPQFTTINSALYFNTTNGNRILIGDVDASTSSLTVTLSVTQGTFTLASLSGLTFTTGDGTTDTSMVFSGNLTNINAALDNAFFTPNNGYTGGASLSLSVDDLANQGTGGAQTASQNLAIQVNSVSYNAITTAPNLVNQNTALNQSAATPLKLDDGRILYVWIDNALDENNTNMTVQGRILNADGTPSTNQFQIGTWAVDGSDDYDIEHLSLAKLSDGNVVVGWVRSGAEAGGDEPVMTIINPSFAPTDFGFVVLSQTEIQQNDTTNLESPPIIKALADGKFIAVWSKNGLDDGETANKVIARIFNANGTAFTGDIQIGTWAVDGADPSDWDNISVTQLTGGNIVVAYVRATDELDGDEPVFTVIDTNGATVRADVEMQQFDTTLWESPPVISALSDGRFMAVWVKDGLNDNGLSMTIQGRIFNADGTPATDEFQVGTSPADGWDEYDTDNVVMTQLDNGNVVVGFVRSSDVANNNWPFFTIINPSITPGQAGFTVAADVQINTTTTQSIGPPVIVSLPGSGGLFAVVRADVNGNSPIYARLYNGSGQPLTDEVLITTNANNQLSSNNDFDVSNLKMIALDQNSVAISWVGVNDGDGTGAYTSILHFNIRPVAANSTVTTNEDVPYVFTAANFNFSDADGDALASIRITSLENAGRLLLNGVDVTLNQVISRASINAGLLTFVPASNANGVAYANFGYSVNDGLQDSDSTYTMTINVTTVPDLVANNDSATGAEDTAINGNVSLNDSTTSGGVLTYAVATAPSNGNLTFNADGTYSYQGNLDYNGIDSFSYTVTDAASGESLTRTVSLTITQVNDAGNFGGNLSGTGNEDTTITGTLTFADPRDGFTLNYTVTGAAGNGTASINASGNWVYTPNANYNGSDSFTVSVTDDDGNIETRVITLTVNPVTDLVANNDSATGAEDTMINGNASLNDSTTSGGVLTYAVATAPSNGNLTFNADGTYSYQGNLDYNGLDSFTYTVTDAASGESLTRTVSLTITQVNDAGTFSGDLSGTGNEETTILGSLNFEDSRDGYTTSNFALQTNGANGVASINGLGQWTYTPNTNFTGVDSFTVLTIDDDGNVETQVISINVQSINDAPTSSDANISFSEDFTFVSALPAASDLNGDAVTYSVFTQPSHGSVVVNANGSFSFSPTLNYNGADQFSFVISDGQGGSTVYLVNVTIAPVNDSPSTSTVTLTSMLEDNTRIITEAELLANVIDVDGDALTVSSLQISSGSGNLINNGNGSWTYTPALNDDSSVSFAFIISDGQATSSGFSSLDITSVDDVVIVDPGTGGGGNGSGGSGGGGTNGDTDVPKENPNDSTLVLLLVDNHQSTNDNTSNNPSGKENTALFDIADKFKIVSNVQNTGFIEPVNNTNAVDDINLISSKVLGNFTYGHGNDQGENTLVRGLKYQQKIVFATNALEEQLGFKEIKVNFDNGAQVSTAILSAGLMAWATQFSGLFASLFASLPSWAALDPMPILNKVDDEDEFDEDADIESNEDDDFVVNKVLG